MPRSLRLATALLFVVASMLLAAPTVHAADPVVVWWAQNTFVQSVVADGDAIADTEQPVSQWWGRSVNLSTSDTWPVTIAVETQIPESTLTATPSPTAVASRGRRTRYDWSTTSGQFANLWRTDQTGSVGFSLERELVGGSLIPGGSAVSRHLIIRFLPSRDLTNYSIDLQLVPDFGPGPGPFLPVVASDPVCAPAPDQVFDPIRLRWYGSISAGTQVEIGCDIHLENTSASPAVYMPWVAGRDFTGGLVSEVPAGETTAVYVDSLLGPTTFAVEPPIGVSHAGRVTSFRTLSAQLQWHNEAPTWSAYFQKGLRDDSPVKGDLLANHPRPFTQFYWVNTGGMGISSGWPVTIEVRTAHPSLVPAPRISPLVGPEGSTFTWTANQYLGVELADRTPVVRAPGLTATRLLIEGRDVAPNESATRTLQLSIDLVDAMESLAVQVDFGAVLGGLVVDAPITVSDLSCPDASMYPPAPFPTYLASWFGLPLSAGSHIDLSCTYTVHNTTAQDARYAPAVRITTSDQPTAQTTAVIGPSVTFDDPDLGTVSIEVRPPGGASVTGELTRSSGYITFGFAGENEH